MKAVRECRQVIELIGRNDELASIFGNEYELDCGIDPHRSKVGDALGNKFGAAS